MHEQVTHTVAVAKLIIVPAGTKMSRRFNSGNVNEDGNAAGFSA